MVTYLSHKILFIIGLAILLGFISIFGIAEILVNSNGSTSSKSLTKSSEVSATGPITNVPGLEYSFGVGHWAVESSPVNIVSSGLVTVRATIPSTDIIPPMPKVTAQIGAAADPISINEPLAVFKVCHPGAVNIVANPDGSHSISAELNCNINGVPYNGTTVWFVG